MAGGAENWVSLDSSSGWLSNLDDVESSGIIVIDDSLFTRLTAAHGRRVFLFQKNLITFGGTLCFFATDDRWFYSSLEFKHFVVGYTPTLGSLTWNDTCGGTTRHAPPFCRHYVTTPVLAARVRSTARTCGESSLRDPVHLAVAESHRASASESHLASGGHRS